MRLIDADAIKEVIDDVCREGIDGVDNELDNDDPVTAMYVARILHLVNNKLKKKIDEAPTVAEQNWAYCEERLPEMEVTRDASFFKKYRSEPVLVQTKRGEIFLAVCEKTEYKDGKRSCVEWYAFGTKGRKMKVMSKVMTWMPQPEPWKPNFPNTENVESKGKE